MRDQAAALRVFLAQHPEVPLADVASTLARGRSHFSHRTGVAGDRGELTAPRPKPVGTPDAPGPVPAVFLASPPSAPAWAGSWPGGRRPGAQALDEVCAVVDPLLGRSLREVMWDEPPGAERTEYAQPALFAHQVALSRLWQAAGSPSTLSRDTRSARSPPPWAAGVLGLEDAARLVVTRGRLMQALPEGGAMAAIAATEDEVAPTLPEGTAVAAVNGPRDGGLRPRSATSPPSRTTGAARGGAPHRCGSVTPSTPR
ncbi:Polyketide synthase OS=Streptomyces antimycoticus OX=68175 GN=SSPO_011720 PE=4 SV=1 [Streptomyces antimycoticus]